jgi:hypothetical protein
MFNPHTPGTPCYYIRRSWEKYPWAWIFGLLGLGTFIGHVFA